jgi:peptidoglycan/LPS O-acetylase OafA/YrhL
LNPPETPIEQPKASPPRNSALDGLRGVAIAMVLWHHFVQLHLPLGRRHWLGWLNAATGLTWTGVDLFFVLSGYFIGGILIDNRDSPHLRRVFYIRRAARILPLFYVTLAVFEIAVRTNAPGSFQLYPAWIYALFLSNFAIALTQKWGWLPLATMWSLAVEEQFYLAAPWVVRMVPAIRVPLLAAGLIVLAEVTRAAFLLAYPHGHLALHVLTPFRMDSLAFGGLLAWAVRSDSARPFFEQLRARYASWLLAASLAFAGLILLQPREGSPLAALIGYPLIAAVFTVVVAVVAKVRPGWLIRFLELSPLTNLGRHSYFIYLWHGFLGGMLISRLGGPDFVLDSLPGLGLVALAIAVTWIAALASWKWLESPIVAWGHRHAY